MGPGLQKCGPLTPTAKPSPVQSRSEACKTWLFLYTGVLSVDGLTIKETYPLGSA